jgi:glycosyltransferase involved in cell wall biosynthesis
MGGGGVVGPEGRRGRWRGRLRAVLLYEWTVRGAWRLRAYDSSVALVLALGAGWEALKALAEDHEARYGAEFKAWVRARNAVYFAQEFRKRGVEHVHVHFTNRATHTALFMKAYAGLPFSITAHAQDFMVDLGSDELLGELCEEATFVAAVSDFSAGLLREKVPESAGKVTRVYNGLEPDDFPKREHVAGTPTPFRILSVGRLIEFKGFHHLLMACAELRADGIEVECTIIGEGDWRERLEALAKDLRVEETVHLPGVKTQEEIKVELARSDVFALPCIVDSKGASDILPTVITEAMASGLPVVSTRLVGVPEMVEDEKTGLLVPPGDVASLAEALRRMAVNDEQRARFGAAGVARAREVFDLEKTSGQLLGLIRETGVSLDEKGSEGGGRGEEKAEVLCLVEEWPGDEYSLLNSEVAWLAGRGRFKVVAMRAADRVKWRDDEWMAEGLAGIDFMPDDLVLEAEWEMSGDGEEAGEDGVVKRQARHLGLLVRKLGIRHVHACRASMGLTAKRVAEQAGVSYSVGVESRPGVSGALLGEICEGARPKVCDLDLALPTPRRRIKIGPLKLRGPPSRWVEPERAAMYERWYGKL